MKISDAYSNSYELMIFDYFHNAPWAGVYNANELNLLYYIRSGVKPVSPTITTVLSGKTELSTENKQQIAKLLETMYMHNWEQVWKALWADYNPIENYSMTESETIDDKKLTSDKGTHDSNTVETNSEDRTVSEQSENKDKSNTYAFDSDVSSPNSENINTSTNQNSDKLAVSNNSTTKGSDSNDKNETGNTKRSLTRSGNIGVTTSQQMIESELNLRKSIYLDRVFNDIDELLTKRVISIDEI